ncbi:hypothetical protein HAHE_11110 [Haloferula helveola]|uniref:PEP-CTERM protein-sorting domain-containing protein n=2 Tax=Haloferula helveola TaxID=490095 RepID=A0ABN6H2E0_9BACT|nr:hypothetical protein HAHE_11110 [Haloferula helveola]
MALVVVSGFVSGRADSAVLNFTNTTVNGIGQSTVTVQSTTYVAGTINNAIFRRPISSDDSKSGSGGFRDLYTVDSNSGAESGYNRDGVMDSKAANGFFPEITVGDLVADSTGLAYVFAIDTNEAGNATDKFISLDDFRIYVGGPTAPSPLPQDFAGVDSQLGVNVYAMNETGQDNHVLLDYSLYSGSGQMDLFVIVPKVFFDGFALDSQVYIYTEFGSYGDAPGFDPSAGPEQVSLAKVDSPPVNPFLTPIPEPSSLVLLLAGGALLFRRRR